jgi:hypothetical protein
MSNMTKRPAGLRALKGCAAPVERWLIEKSRWCTTP